MKVHKEIAAWIGSAGYAARGFVFLAIGLFAVAAAIGWRSNALGAGGLFSAIDSQPFGEALLVIVAVGFSCFAAWRVMQSVLDIDNYGVGSRGLARRIGFGASAVAHAGLAIWAVTFLAVSRSDPAAGAGASDWSAWLLGLPFGRWLLGAIGLGMGLVGVAAGVRGWKAKFRTRLRVAGTSRKWILALGRVGFFARAFVFLLVGALIVVAAWNAEPGTAAGLSGALRSLGEQPYGWIVLGVTALGIIAFGLFELFQAAFHRFDRG